MALRLLFDARYATPHFPGIGRYVHNLVRVLAQQPDLSLLLLLNPDQVPAFRQLAPTAQLQLTAARPLSLAEQAALPRLIRQLQPDLYHAPYYLRPYLPVGCPSLLTFYDAIPLRFPQEATIQVRLSFRWLTRLALRQSNHVVAISEHAAKDLHHWFGVPHHRISITRLAADPRFQPAAPAVIDQVRQRYGIPAEYLLTVCSNKPHKNLMTLVQAYQQVTAAPPLVIAGHWDPRYPEALRLAQQQHLPIQFIHNIAEADLPGLYSGALCFIYPSRYEGFGLPPLEALACGVPVICGQHSSLPEVVGTAAYFSDIHHPLALAGSIQHFLQHPADRQQDTKRSQQQAAHFRWEQTAQATMNAYRRVLHQG